mgnify:CR=1 FL=1
MKFSRRSFIRTTGAGILAAGIPAYGRTLNAEASPAKPDSFRLALAGYTFAKFNLDDSLAMMKRTGVKLLGVKDCPFSIKHKIDFR